MKFKTTNNGMSRLGNGLLALAVCGCFGFLASCSSDDSISDGGSAGLTTASTATVKASTGSRSIVNYKALSTAGRAAITVSSDNAAYGLAIPTFTIPTVDNSTVFSLGNTVESDKTYVLVSGEGVISGCTSGVTVYVAKGATATVKDDGWGSGGKIYVADGGTLIYDKNKVEGYEIVCAGTLKFTATSGQIDIYKDCYVKNLVINDGLKLYPHDHNFYVGNGLKAASLGLTGSNGKASVKIVGDVNLTGDLQTGANNTLYIEGGLTCKALTPTSGGKIGITGDVTFTEGLSAFGYGLMQVGGALTAPDFYVNDDGVVEVFCSMKVNNTLQVNGDNGKIGNLKLMDHGYVEAGTIKFTASSMITIQDGGMIKANEELQLLCCGTNALTLEGDNAKGAIVTKALKVNVVDLSGKTADKVVFIIPGSSELALVYESVNGDNRATAAQKIDVPSEVATYTNTGELSDKLKAFKIAKEGCNPGFNGDGSEPTPEITPDPTPEPDPTPKIETVTQITPDHTHPISATCVDYDPTNQKIYLSWHARDEGQAGCLEIIDHSEAEKPQLVSYLQAYTKDVERDKQQHIDYNHCILYGDKLYAVGNSHKYVKGTGEIKYGHVSYVQLSNGLFAGTETQRIDETDLTSAGILKITELTPHENSKGVPTCDGNCIIRQGDDFLVASTAGFETFDNNLKSTNFVSTPGKGKHIATDGNKILTLNYDKRITSEQDPLTAIVKAYSASDHTFATPTAVASTDWVAPNNGKNTIKIDGNNAYVCCEKNGLIRYDINGGGQNGKFYIEPKIKADGKEFYSGYCNGVDVDDKYVYVAYGSCGLFILDKNSMEKVAEYTAAGGKSANYVKVVQRDDYRYIYVAYGESGLRIFRITK